MKESHLIGRSNMLSTHRTQTNVTDGTSPPANNRAPLEIADNITSVMNGIAVVATTKNDGDNIWSTAAVGPKIHN